MLTPSLRRHPGECPVCGEAACGCVNPNTPTDEAGNVLIVVPVLEMRNRRYEIPADGTQPEASTSEEEDHDGDGMLD